MVHIPSKQSKYLVYTHIFPNDKVYIGITSQKPNERWKNGKGYYGSTRIHNAIQKHGWENIQHEILYENLTKEEAEKKEKELIQKYKSYDDKYGYNLELGGNLNKEISEETRKKLSKKLSGKNNPMYGKHMSEENKKKMSVRNKGKNNPMYGKSANKGKHLTEEQKQKLSKIMNSPEVHKKLSEAKLSDIEKVISSLGLYHNKAKAIQGFAKVVVEEYEGKIPEDMNGLVKLPGVGRKCANVIQSECFNIPALAVDTHVNRVSKRLGLAYQKDSVDKVEMKLKRKVPKERWIKTHHQMIFFGRYLCHAKNPECEKCPFIANCREKHKSI